MGGSTARCARGAAVLALIIVPGLAASPSSIAVGGAAVRTSHRATVAACDYAARHGQSAARRACRKIEATRVFATASTTYQNPIYGPAPDPVAVFTGSDYYAYHTGSNFPVLHSTDLVNWAQVGTALTARPSWVVASGDWHPWSPSVLASSSSCPGTSSPGCYILYYTGLNGGLSPTTHCVAAAYSTTPAGPFTDLGPLSSTSGQVDSSGRPPGCGDNAGYSNIDPAPFVDSDGRAYLYVATNRTCAQVSPGLDCPFLPSVSVLPLSPDLMHVAGARTRLFGGAAGTWEDQAGQGPKVEGPWLEKRSSTYYLFYSGGAYTAAYGMGYATATAPAGSFRKSSRNPILRETSEVYSPGGGSLIKGPRGGDWLIYHGRAGSYSAPRALRIDPVVWNRKGAVSVHGPTTGPQSPAP
jgi:beta-xylosidase